MTRFQNIRAISFDADDTLWEFQKVMRHSLKCSMDELTTVRPETEGKLTIDAMIGIREEVAENLKGKVVDLEEVRLEAFRETIARVGLHDDALARRLNDVYFSHRFEDIELYDDVLETLDTLEGEFVLGILSNGNSYPEKCGLEGKFQFAVFAPDHGFAKPEPRLFHIAVEQAGCAPSSLLHVGDSLEDDVKGAGRAGVRSVWLNRGKGSKQNRYCSRR